jgi:hypothetical protein
MEKTKAEENRTAYDDFLTRLDKAMRETFGLSRAPLEVSSSNPKRPETSDLGPSHSA